MTREQKKLRRRYITKAQKIASKLPENILRRSERQINDFENACKRYYEPLTFGKMLNELVLRSRSPFQYSGKRVITKKEEK